MLKKKYFRPNIRGRYWLINMLKFYSLKIITRTTRDKSLWIFGCWEGNRYDDNSRYLFEYINKNHPDIRAVWLTNREDILKRVKQLGYEVYLANSKEGRRIQLKAGVVFHTNGLDDFGFHCLFYGAKICALWHGVGIKKTYFASVKRKTLGYWKNRVQNMIFSWVYRDITITSSELSSDYYSKSFCISKDNMALTGFPRDDIFSMNIDKQDVFQDKSNSSSKIILYMPTYRDYEDKNIRNTISLLASDTILIDSLRCNKAKILIKKHYLTKIEDIELPDVIDILDSDKVSSTQELLAVADLLITDYSSCILDYSLTKRPSLLYAPDFNIYDENVGVMDEWRGLYEEYSLKSFHELKYAIMDVLDGKQQKGEKTAEYILNLFEDEKIIGNCYSENVYRYIKECL